ncbi:DUF3574 domain-containing protein [Phenylobacterium sp.]|uniref:DUF3574 domain-containing protein n=1 Tax=Phenylobacterium sp. TaxID=1871053 RepID=UPI0028119533|nr:DUF3574 domain-containing protein [Phenylobacterium sp.]
MKALGGMLAAVGLAGCATLEAPSCPAGQEHLRTAQLFLGGQPGAPAVRDAELRTFVDQEITPRFPNGVTVLDGGGQWRGAENQLIRQAQKVVLIVLPARGDTQKRLQAVRTAYQTRFRQDSVVVTQAACVAV